MSLVFFVRLGVAPKAPSYLRVVVSSLPTEGRTARKRVKVAVAEIAFVLRPPPARVVGQRRAILLCLEPVGQPHEPAAAGREELSEPFDGVERLCQR